MLYPPNILQNHRYALDVTWGELQAEIDVRGILIGGSVGNNRATAESDLDLFVVHKESWYQRRLYTVAGVKVDLFLDCEAHLHEQLRSDGNNVILHNYATGWIALDPRGLISQLQEKARKIARQPRHVRPDEDFFHSTRVHNSFDDFRHSDVSDETATLFKLQRFVHACIEALYARHKRWKTTTKNVLVELRTFDPEAATIVEGLLLARAPIADLAMQAASLADLAMITKDLRRLHGPKWGYASKPTVLSLGNRRITLTDTSR